MLMANREQIMDAHPPEPEKVWSSSNHHAVPNEEALATMEERRKLIVQEHRRWKRKREHVHGDHEESDTDALESLAKDARRRRIVDAHRQWRAKQEREKREKEEREWKKREELDREAEAKREQDRELKKNPFLLEARRCRDAELRKLERDLQRQQDVERAKIQVLQLQREQQQREEEQQTAGTSSIRREHEMKTLKDLQVSLLQEQKRTLELQRSLLSQVSTSPSQTSSEEPSNRPAIVTSAARDNGAEETAAAALSELGNLRQLPTTATPSASPYIREEKLTSSRLLQHSGTAMPNASPPPPETQPTFANEDVLKNHIVSSLFGQVNTRPGDSEDILVASIASLLGRTSARGGDAAGMARNAGNANDVIRKASMAASLLGQATARASEARTSSMNAGNANDAILQASIASLLGKATASGGDARTTSSMNVGESSSAFGMKDLMTSSKRAVDVLRAASGISGGCLLPGLAPPPASSSRVLPEAAAATTTTPRGPIPVDLLQHFSETALHVQRAARAG